MNEDQKSRQLGGDTHWFLPPFLHVHEIAKICGVGVVKHIL